MIMHTDKQILTLSVSNHGIHTAETMWKGVQALVLKTNNVAGSCKQYYSYLQRLCNPCFVHTHGCEGTGLETRGWLTLNAGSTRISS